MELAYILQLDKSDQIFFNGFSQKAFWLQLNNKSLYVFFSWIFHNHIFLPPECEIPAEVAEHVMLAIEAGNVKFIPHTCFSLPLKLCQNATLLLEAKQISDAFHFPDMCATCHNVLQVLFAFEEERISLLCAFLSCYKAISSLAGKDCLIGPVHPSVCWFLCVCVCFLLLFFFFSALSSCL